MSGTYQLCPATCMAVAFWHHRKACTLSACTEACQMSGPGLEVQDVGSTSGRHPGQPLSQGKKLVLQEVSAQSAGAHSSDLAILAVAARQLFESTREMVTEAVVSILVGLRTVSLRSLPHAAQQPGMLK